MAYARVDTIQWPKSLLENQGIPLPDPRVQPLIPLHIAGFYLQQSRSVTWQQDKDGTFPVEVLRLQPKRPSVRTIDLYRLLGLPLPSADGGEQDNGDTDDA